ncbi:alcohol dehydrogenase catalytic domain-containing protein [Limosilactobacillus fermentum]|uniref:alcohol dehydrogenase catalytic domain-containing protein n=1 Tax=Limosilactobacillus fermentum TaxID=1613 RepID=UPI003F03690D
MVPGLVEVQDVDKPTVKNPDDVVIKVLRACVCGSDLWAYRGLDDKPANSINSGHEAIGIVEEVGADITTVKPGDFVIAPFTHGCGHCPACLAGFDAVCQDHSDNFSNGTQAEYYLAQHAQWSLVKVPGKPEDYSEAMLKSFLTLADVMATGYHAARVADVKPGDTVVVMGDGAVGLSAIIAAKLRGAKRIISTSRHDGRRELAAEFGATDNVAERGDEAVENILAMTNGGADAVLECVGTAQSTDTAMKVGRPGAIVGRVGLPHDDKDLLLKAVLDGKINPGKVFTKTFTLDEINDAYQAMADRQVIKSYVKVRD